jgi:stringent starvation protein B
MKTLDELKRDIFYGFLELGGRAYIQVRPSEGVSIGRRGFVGEEQEKGIVLVFNTKMKFGWNVDGLSATLMFGTSPEKCFIPAEDIVAIYSPELGAQFTVSPEDVEGEGGPEEPDDNVIQVDFKKKRH